MLGEGGRKFVEGVVPSNAEISDSVVLCEEDDELHSSCQISAFNTDRFVAAGVHGRASGEKTLGASAGSGDG